MNGKQGRKIKSVSRKGSAELMIYARIVSRKARKGRKEMNGK